MRNLLLSISGGETSGFMMRWVLENKLNDFDNVAIVFANTSKEREETLIFMDQLTKEAKEFNVPVYWIEATFDGLKGIGYRETNFKEVKRNGEVFEDMIKCYGLPNKAYPHCTRELKTQPITRFAKEHFNGEKWTTTIGIRADEVDRINKKWRELGYWYPLIADIYTTKPHVNKHWKGQEYRLDLKGYEGNCDMCWKKSNRKLLTLIKEKPNLIEWWDEMEEKYKNYVPPHRDRKYNNEDITFYRSNLSAKDLKEMSKEDFNKADNDAVVYDIQETLWGYDLDSSNGCEESCEPF